jgi:RNA polymerase sigma factor (TIGR02999 family)
MQDGEDLDRLLKRWSSGDRSAMEELMPLVYGELHAIAARYRRAEGREPTLQTTELLHEAFLKMAGTDRTWWTNRGQFFALAAKIIRNILVDGARRRRVREAPEAAAAGLAALAPSMPAGLDLEALDLALMKLEQTDREKARLVELRFFGGLSVDETAEVMGIGSATVKRHWSVARAWLYREMNGPLPE